MADDFRNMSSVELGMSLLKQTKEEAERERKRREKLDRKYGMAKLLTSGLKYMVKERFNAFENDMMPQKAQLQHIYNKAQDVLETQDIIDKNFGGDSLAYWTDFYKKQFAATGAEMYSNYDQALLSQYYVSKAEEQARKKNSQWSGIVSEARDIPTNIEDLDSQWSRYAQSQVPNNVFGWATRGIKNLLSGKSKQEIENEGKVQRDLFLNSNYFKEYGELQRAYEQQEKVNPSAVRQIFEDLFSKLSDEERESLRKPFDIKVFGPVNAGGKSISGFNVIYRDPNKPGGFDVQQVITNQGPRTDREPPSDKDLRNIADRMDVFYKGSKEYNEYKQLTRVDGNEFNSAFFSDLANARQDIRDLGLSREFDTEEEIYDFLINRKKQGLTLNVTQYDIDDRALAAFAAAGKIENAEKVFENMLDQVPKYLDQLSTYSGTGQAVAADKLYNGLKDNIVSVFEDEPDRVRDELQVLNEQFGYDMNKDIEETLIALEERKKKMFSVSTGTEGEDLKLEEVNVSQFKNKVPGIFKDTIFVNPIRTERGYQVYRDFGNNQYRMIGIANNRDLLNYLDSYFK